MTGSLVKGTVDGMGKGFGAISDKVTLLVDGSPDDLLQVNVGSQIAYSVADGEYYMGKTGSTWITLGSVA